MVLTMSDPTNSCSSLLQAPLGTGEERCLGLSVELVLRKGATWLPTHPPQPPLG